MFTSAAWQVDIKSVLASEPQPTIRKNKIYSVVISQPLAHGCSWKDKKKKVANWSFYLSGFGHGVPSSYSLDLSSKIVPSSVSPTIKSTASIETSGEKR